MKPMTGEPLHATVAAPGANRLHQQLIMKAESLFKVF